VRTSGYQRAAGRATGRHRHPAHEAAAVPAEIDQSIWRTDNAGVHPARYRAVQHSSRHYAKYMATALEERARRQSCSWCRGEMETRRQWENARSVTVMPDTERHAWSKAGLQLSIRTRRQRRRSKACHAPTAFLRSIRILMS